MSDPISLPSWNQLATPVTKPAASKWNYAHAAATALLAIGLGGYVANDKMAPPVKTPQAETPKAVAPTVPDVPPSVPQVSPYEEELRAAWDIEQSAGVYGQQRRLLYLYRFTARAVPTLKTHGDLYDAFAKQEALLEMKGTLPFVRGVVAKYWPISPKDAAAELTPESRSQVVKFMQQTIAVLETLK